MLQLHELLAYLGQKAVTTLLIYGQKGLFPIAPTISDLDISYLTDNVLLFRYYEHNGEVRQAISVFKRRGGPHERTIRDLRLGSSGIEVGPQLHDFRGVLTGQPTLHRQRSATWVGMKETEISLDNEPMRVFRAGTGRPRCHGNCRRPVGGRIFCSSLFFDWCALCAD